MRSRRGATLPVCARYADCFCRWKRKQLEQLINNTLAVTAQPRDVSNPARGCESAQIKLFSMLSLLSPNPCVVRRIFRVIWGHCYPTTLGKVKSLRFEMVKWLN